jgi:phytanoyl-CoA hydroxylase
MTEELPLYRSPFGGLWIDRRDAHALLAKRRDEYGDELSAALEHFIDKGYVVFKNAVPTDLCDEYVKYVEDTWRNPPAPLYAHWNRQVVELSMAIFDEVAKVSDLHYHFRRAHELIYPKPVLDFMQAIYERPPVVFQTMTMRKGSEEELHTDTGPLTLTEPLGLAASWLALEDVDIRAGALMYVPGSHHQEALVNGVSKAHNGDMIGYGKALAEQRRKCDALGYKTEHFLAKKGDVLIWAADLLHGGAPIQDRSRTRKSLVAHFTPYGAFPTFYDYSTTGCIRYPNGGYRLDRVIPIYEQKEKAPQPQEPPPPPPRLRDRVQRALGAALSELKR